LRIVWPGFDSGCNHSCLVQTFLQSDLTGKRGRQTKYEGKVNLDAMDMKRFSGLEQGKAELPREYIVDSGQHRQV